MNRLFSLLIAIIFCAAHMTAQSFTQQLRGAVTQDESTTPVSGCMVSVTGAMNASSLTDSTGFYRLELVPGKYTLTFYKPGYSSIVIDNVSLIKNKQYVQDIALQPLRARLDTVRVGEQSSTDVAVGADASANVPAAFYDPARAVTTSAGAANADDQNNNICVYGTSPAFVQWKLEGMEIVNPNHLENGGAINDRASVNGGGVSILSAQVLGSSKFIYAPALSQGNALTGTFDIRFKNGNNQRTERTAQLGLLGTDLAMEGPFKKNRNASYLVNYRYSTLGLLSLMGVTFGDEKINYQDLSYAISLPTKFGTFRVFGMGGLSTDKFIGATDTAKVETQKDLFNVNYKSLTGASGVTHLVSLNNVTYMKTGVLYSAKGITRESTPTNLAPVLPSNSDAFIQQKLSGTIFIARRFGCFTAKTGALAVNNLYNLKQDSTQRSVTASYLQPYVSAEQITAGKFVFNAGVKLFIQPELAFQKLLPDASAQFNITDAQSIALAYGTMSQLQPFTLYDGPNQKLKPSSCQAATFAYRVKIRSSLIIAKAFDYEFTGLPSNDSAGFSTFNYFNETVLVALQNKGTAYTRGGELNLHHAIRSWQIHVSGAAFDSRANIAGHWANGRYNSRYNLVLMLGREFRLNHKRSLVVFVKGTDRGGFYEPQINDSPYRFTQKLPDYFRIDTRICLKTDRARMSSQLALDIQNVTNQQNISYNYYDFYLGKVISKYQNGLVPVLSYRVFF